MKKVADNPLAETGDNLYSPRPTLVLFQVQLCGFVCLLLACLTSQQHASVSQGWICTDNFTCCHTEIAVADQTFYVIQSQYTDTRPTSASADPIMPGAWQGSHWSANFEVTSMTRPRKILLKAGFEPRIFRSRVGCLYHSASDPVTLWDSYAMGQIMYGHF